MQLAPVLADHNATPQPAITIRLREVYGTPHAYPVCDKARAFADMLGTKTLTPHALRHINKLGFTIHAVDAFGMVAGRVVAN